MTALSEALKLTSKKTGLPPGSLVHTGDTSEPTTTIRLTSYNEEKCSERQIQDLDEILQYQKSNTVTWVMIEGLADINVVEKIGSMFNIHPLVLEDILNTHQRPKFEEYDDYLYIVLKHLVSEDEAFAVTDEQVSLLVLRDIVFTFREKRDHLFHPIQERIRSSKGRIRKLKTDYLAYAVLDTIVDQNFILLDSLDDDVTAIEENLFAEPTQETRHTIQKLKREIINIRKTISPIRELMMALLRSESPLIHKSTHIYFRDVADHTLRVIESIESYRDILAVLLDIYISSVSNKMNETMKVLTVFASIFIPLTFIAGIYGMNFEYMPELKWRWAYPALWSVFIIIPIILLTYFKKKKWL
jgi:magnesium transporter